MTPRLAPRRSRNRHLILVWAVVALVGWGVLAFGAAVYPWAYAPLYAGCTVVGVASLVICWRRGELSDRVRLGSLSAGLALTAAAVALQLVPVPIGWLDGVSPERDAFLRDYSLPYAMAAVSTEIGAEQSARASLHPVSIRPDLTQRGLAFLAALSLFVVGLSAVLSSADARRIAAAVATLGLLVAMAGIIQKSTGTSKIYGLWTPEVGQGPFGPFVNKNHFAGWMLMTIPLSVGLWSGIVADAMRGVKAGWRDRILWLSSPEASRVVLLGFGLAIMGLSLVLSLSRSGITCLAVATGILVWLALRRQRDLSRRAFSVVYLTFALVAAVGWAGLDMVAQRFATASWGDVGGRFGIWGDTVRIAKDFWPFGTGLNTYGEAMLTYQTHVLEYHFVQAHNDYLQLAAEGGLLVGLPVLITVVVLSRAIRSRFTAAADDVRTYWIRVGATVGLVAIALQSLVDFSLQMAGNAVLFAVLIAIALHTPSSGDRSRQVRVVSD